MFNKKDENKKDITNKPLCFPALFTQYTYNGPLKDEDSLKERCARLEFIVKTQQETIDIYRSTVAKMNKVVGETLSFLDEITNGVDDSNNKGAEDEKE